MKPGPVIGLLIGTLATTAQACPAGPEDGARVSDREVQLKRIGPELFVSERVESEDVLPVAEPSLD